MIQQIAEVEDRLNRVAVSSYGDEPAGEAAMEAVSLLLPLLRMMADRIAALEESIHATQASDRGRTG